MRMIALLAACCVSLLAQIVKPANPESALAGRVIGKPFSATQLTHSVQTLVDGSHIDRTVTNLIWQDDQGRYRTETTDAPRRVVIQDTVAMVAYSIDLENKTARQTSMKLAPKKIAGDVNPVEEERAMAVRTPNHHLVEDLGVQSMNGVPALGVRVTTTIPLGAMGNDRELKSVTERWYSNDIHALVKTITADPRTGTSTYELTNIVRAAPDPALFNVPPGITVNTVDNAALPSPTYKKQ
jgi:hypothetical protein